MEKQSQQNGATLKRKMVSWNMIRTQQVSIIWGPSIYLNNWRKISINFCRVSLWFCLVLINSNLLSNCIAWITGIQDPIPCTVGIWTCNENLLNLLEFPRKHLLEDAFQLSKHLQNRGRPTERTWAKYKEAKATRKGLKGLPWLHSCIHDKWFFSRHLIFD